MPKRALSTIGSDVGRETIGAYRRAIETAVGALEADDTDARVLNLSCGPGVSAVHAIRAGARHVTAAERWLYLSLATKETMLENEMDEARYDVVYKRPTDLRLREDVPVSCNVLVIGTDGVELESGVLLAAKHCFEEGLVMDGAVLLPGVLRVMARVGAFDRGGGGEFVPATEAKEAWYFDLKTVYDRSETKELELPRLSDEGVRTGAVTSDIEGGERAAGAATSDIEGGERATADSNSSHDSHHHANLQPTRATHVEFWYELDLLDETVRRPSRFQRLAGELMLTGDEVVLTASHNTVGMRFDVSSSNYIRLFGDSDGDDVDVGGVNEVGGRDGVPLEVYQLRDDDGGNDGGSDGGSDGGNDDTAVLIPQASNMRRVIEALEASERRVKIVTTDLRKGTDPVQLQRGRNGVPIDGVDVVMLYDRKGRYNMVEQWRTALGFSKVVPSKVTWWCAGAEAVTRPVEGVKLACLDRYRESGWLHEESGRHHHRLLTDRHGVKSTLMKLKVNDNERGGGYLNAVVYWHDLDGTLLTHWITHWITRPHWPSLSRNGTLLLLSGVDGFAHNARIVYLDRAVRVEAGSKVSVIGGGTETDRTFKLRGNVGTPRALPPWEVTWGGGASVENPHYQRVHYCELILREFLGVVERGKTDIWKDVEMVLRHCGSLFLDRRTVMEVGRRLRSMERGLLLAGRGVSFSRWVDVFDDEVWFC